MLKLGKMQHRFLPMHMVREFCRLRSNDAPWYSWDPKAMFDTDFRYTPAPQGGEFSSWGDGSKIDIDSERFANNFGNRFTLFRGDDYPRFFSLGTLVPLKWINLDLATHSRLLHIRQTDLAKHLAKRDQHYRLLYKDEIIKALNTPEQLKKLMQRIPKHEVLPIVKMPINKDYDKDTILYRVASEFPAALDIILNFIPRDQMLETIVVEMIAAALGQLESVKLILKVIPPEQVLDLIGKSDLWGAPFLHNVAIYYPKVLQAMLEYIPPSQWQDAINVKDSKGCTVLAAAGRNSKSMQIIQAMVLNGSGQSSTPLAPASFFSQPGASSHAEDDGVLKMSKQNFG